MDASEKQIPLGPIPDGICCLNCGYNLKFQPMEAVCPECGQPVSVSVQQSLAHADQDWLVELRRGTRWLLVGMVSALLSPSPMAFSVLTKSFGSSGVWMLCLVGLAFLSYLHGFGVFTKPEPHGSEQKRFWKYVGWLLLWILLFYVSDQVFLEIVNTFTRLTILVPLLFVIIYRWPMLVTNRIAQLGKRAYDATLLKVVRMFRILWVTGLVGVFAWLLLPNFVQLSPTNPFPRIGQVVVVCILAFETVLHAWLVYRARRILQRAIDRRSE